MARNLVTGANGHLGTSIVRALLAAGQEVRAFVRRGADTRGLAGLDVEYAHGDLLDAASVTAAARGCARMFHAGAVNRNWARHAEDILRPSVEGTANALQAAAAAGIERVVHTSSNATIGYARSREAPYDETHVMRGARSPYIRAKCEAEAVALERGRALGVPVVVVNPVGILGPWDYRLTPTTRAILGMAKGGPSVVDVCLTHVADLAEAHLLAAERGVPGERYLLAGENLGRERIAEITTRLTGRQVKPMSPPAWLLRGLATAQELRAMLTGKDAEITRAMLDDVAGGVLFYDGSKARAAFGWTPRDGEAVLVDALRWLVHLGLVDGGAVAPECRVPDPGWNR